MGTAGNRRRMRCSPCLSDSTEHGRWRSSRPKMVPGLSSCGRRRSASLGGAKQAYGGAIGETVSADGCLQESAAGRACQTRVDTWFQG